MSFCFLLLKKKFLILDGVLSKEAYLAYDSHESKGSWHQQSGNGPRQHNNVTETKREPDLL